jgi:hypothetical protein
VTRSVRWDPQVLSANHSKVRDCSITSSYRQLVQMREPLDAGCTSPSTRRFVSGSLSVAPIRTPMRGIAACCARVANGHAARTAETRLQALAFRRRLPFASSPMGSCCCNVYEDFVLIYSNFAGWCWFLKSEAPIISLTPSFQIGWPLPRSRTVRRIRPQEEFHARKRSPRYNGPVLGTGVLLRRESGLRQSIQTSVTIHTSVNLHKAVRTAYSRCGLVAR